MSSIKVFSWNIEEVNGWANVGLKGPINEDSAFDELITDLSRHDKVKFYLNSVERINSCGVREWVNFLNKIHLNKEIILSDCSPAIVQQLNMIENFSGNAKIESVYAPFVCEECDHEENVKFQVSNDIPNLENQSCPNCSSHMEFDDLEESYFSFVAA